SLACRDDGVSSLWASVTGTSISDRVRDVLRLAEADPGRSVPLATALAREARAGHDLASASVAERALGLAALHLKDPDAAMRHLLGRLDEALASYRLALPALRRAGDDVWTKRVLSNRGVLHGQRHEFAAAQADLTEAEALCRRLDQGLTLAFIQQNLGWVHG